MQQIPKDTSPRSPWKAWTARLIHLYPAYWQERYADEMLAILEERPATLWTFVDMLLSLCDAYLHGNLVSGRVVGMVKQFYSSVATIFGAGLLFCLISSEILTFLTNISRDIPPVGVPTLPIYQPLLLVLNFLSVALVSLVGFCAGSLLLSTGRRAIRTRCMRPFFLSLSGIFCLAIAFITYSLVYNLSSRYIHDHLDFFLPLLLLSKEMLFFLVCIPSVLLSLLLVGVGIRALRAALRLATPGIHLSNLILAAATMISTMLVAYSGIALCFIVYSFSFGPFSNLTQPGERSRAILLLVFDRSGSLLTASMLLASYSLVRAYQARRTFKVQIQ